MLFVVDARAGVTPGDEELAQILRESKKDVLLLANKIDDPSQESLALDLHRLGFGEPFPISALHGSNTGDLLDEVLDRLPGVSAARSTTTRSASRSSAVRTSASRRCYNKLVGEERTIVDEVPGHDARHDRHGRPDRTAARSSSSTPPACGASAGSARASTTTRSCARSTPPNVPTWRSS